MTVLDPIRVGDFVRVPHRNGVGRVKRIAPHKLGVDVLLSDNTYIQTHRRNIQSMLTERQKEDRMVAARQEQAETRISINIIGTGYMKKCTIVASRGDLCYLHTFDHIDGKTDWNAQIATAQAGLTGIEVTPPPDIDISDAPERPATVSQDALEGIQKIMNCEAKTLVDDAREGIVKIMNCEGKTTLDKAKEGIVKIMNCDAQPTQPEPLEVAKLDQQDDIIPTKQAALF